MKLQISKAIHGQMIDHCIAGLPNEACGFIAGAHGIAQHIYLLTNAAASPVFYRPVDKEMLAALTDIDEKGWELLSIFHSHVASAPAPSPTDIREAHYPDAAYIIVSLTNIESPEVRGWLIRKQQWQDTSGELEEIELVIS